MTKFKQNFTLNEIINNLDILNIDKPYSNYIYTGKPNFSNMNNIINKVIQKQKNYEQYFTSKPVFEYIPKLFTNNTTRNNLCVATDSFINRMYEYIHDKEEKKDERQIIYVVNKYSRYKNKYMYDNKRTMEKRKIRKIFRK